MSAPAALAQGDVGEHLGGAADDRRLRVDGGVAGQHPDVVGAEDRDQREELLRDQRLDRGGVERPLAAGQGREVRAGGDQALAGAGRGAEDDVRAGDDLDQRLLLRRVEAQALLLGPGPERLEQRVGVGGIGGKAVEEGHLAPIVPDRPPITQSEPATPQDRRVPADVRGSACPGVHRPALENELSRATATTTAGAAVALTGVLLGSVLLGAWGGDDTAPLHPVSDTASAQLPLRQPTVAVTITARPSPVARPAAQQRRRDPDAQRHRPRRRPRRLAGHGRPPGPRQPRQRLRPLGRAGRRASGRTP